MPTACAKVEKQNSIESSEPLKNVQVLVDKKIRNLEKRKAKLEQLKQDQSEGKTLNDDQRKAIKRFDEVIELLDFFKEFNKNVSTIFTDHAKATKKQQKKEQAEKQQQDTDRFRNVLLFQDILNKLANVQIRQDFSAGSNGAFQLTEAQLSNLDELKRSLIVDPLTINVPDSKELEISGERLCSLVDGKSKEVLNGITFKEMRELLVKISESDYFKNKKENVATQLIEEQITQECDNITVTQQERYNEQSVEINNRLTGAVNESQNLQQGVYNVMQPRYDNNQDPAVISISGPYTPTFISSTQEGLPPHAMNLATTTQKVNFEDVNAHQPIPTQTFTNQNYNFQSVSISQPTSIAVGGMTVSGIPVQTVSPHQIHASSPTEIITEQAQINQQQQQQQLINQQQTMDSNQSFTEWSPLDTHVDSNLTSHESGINTFGGDEQSSFAQHGQYQKRDGYRGRGSRGGNRVSMNGYGRQRGGHNRTGFSNNTNNTNGSFYNNEKRPNYGNRPGVHKGQGRGGPGGPGNRNQNSNYGGFQGKAHHLQQPQHQQQQPQQ